MLNPQKIALGIRLSQMPFLFGLVLILCLLPACDTAGIDDGLLTLPERDVTFRYQFTVEEPVGGGNPQPTISAISQSRVDLGELIVAEGFTKDEVESVTITEMELRRVQPTGATLSSLIRGIDVLLDPAGLSPVSVGGLSPIIGGSSAELNVDRSDITLLTANTADFGTRIVVDGPIAEMYVLEITMRLRIEVSDV